MITISEPSLAVEYSAISESLSVVTNLCTSLLGVILQHGNQIHKKGEIAKGFSIASRVLRIIIGLISGLMSAHRQ